MLRRKEETNERRKEVKGSEEWKIGRKEK